MQNGGANGKTMFRKVFRMKINKPIELQPQ